jgi:hypothetical protein
MLDRIGKAEKLNTRHRRTSEMSNLQVTPPRLQILGNKATMTVFRLCLTAKQDRAFEDLLIEGGVHAPLRQEFEEAALVVGPFDFPAAVGAQKLFCRCEQWLVQVVDRANLFEEIGKILALSKASQLRYVVQADVNQSAYSRRS